MCVFFGLCSLLSEIENFANIIITKDCTLLIAMFAGCYKLANIDCSNWDVSNVINMQSTFYDCSTLVSVGDLSNWDTGNVISMNQMFTNCNSLNSVGDLSNWDVSNVISMNQMFAYCTSLISVGDLSNWDTGKIIIMQQMFCNCYYMINPNLLNTKVFDVEQYLNDINIDKLIFSKQLQRIGNTELEVMYNDCFPPCLEYVQISNHNTNFKSINNELVLSNDGTKCYGGADYKISHEYETYYIPEGVTQVLSGALRDICSDIFSEIINKIITNDTDISYNDDIIITPVTHRKLYRHVTLKHIVFPSTITWIGDRVCQYADFCESVTILATTPPTLFTTMFFNNHADNFKIYVPAESVSTYKSATNWNSYASYIEAIPTT